MEAKTKFAICVKNEDYPASLQLWKVYRVLDDRKGCKGFGKGNFKALFVSMRKSSDVEGIFNGVGYAFGSDSRRYGMKHNVISSKARYCGVMFMVLSIYVCLANGQSPAGIQHATLLESGQKTGEISTEELRAILADRSATVFDARPFREYAISHIPGSINVSAKPGVPISVYVSDVAEIGRVLKGDKAAPIILYCNGPFCGKSKRLAAELLEAGYTNVRRYQLGIPVWRALGGVTQIEPEGIRHVVENDRSAVFIDTRDIAEFRRGSIKNARNLPRSLVKEDKDVGEVKAAKDDGRLPMEDHNTRIIVFGSSAEQAKAVAEALVKEAFHNVSFFNGNFRQFKSALHP